MSNDLQTNMAYFMMINYDKLWQFFALPPYGNLFCYSRGSKRVKHFFMRCTRKTCWTCDTPDNMGEGSPFYTLNMTRNVNNCCCIGEIFF